MVESFHPLAIYAATSVLPRKQVNILIGRILKRQFTSFSSVVLILAKCFGAKQYESPKVNNKKNDYNVVNVAWRLVLLRVARKQTPFI